jgi:hypothetical protein
MDQLLKDFQRFQTLHSWYKHIPLEGLDFYVFQAKDDQILNGIDTHVDDMSGVHWHFSIEKPEQLELANTVRFGPFLRGIEGNGQGSEYVSGCWVIRELAGESFDAWLLANYPQYKDSSWTFRDMSNPTILDIYRCEVAKYWEALRSAVGI